MSYIVTENCVDCMNMSCEKVCPTNCFYYGYNFITINSDECISCGICLKECLIDAIKHKDLLTLNQRIFLEINQELSKIWKERGEIFKKNKNTWNIFKKKLHTIKI